MAADTLNAVVKPDPGETATLDELKDAVDGFFRSGYTPCLIGPQGEQLELPQSVFEALRTIVLGMAAGQTMTLMPAERMLTTQQAADILQVSRPHLVKLIDEGAIPYEYVGRHRRVAARDVMEYRETRSSMRRDTLRELSQISADTPGGYR